MIPLRVCRFSRPMCSTSPPLIHTWLGYFDSNEDSRFQRPVLLPLNYTPKLRLGLVTLLRCHSNCPRTSTFWWEGLDSNQLTPKRSDLQSDAPRHLRRLPKTMVERIRVELTFPACKAGVLTNYTIPPYFLFHFFILSNNSSNVILDLLCFEEFSVCCINLQFAG